MSVRKSALGFILPSIDSAWLPSSAGSGIEAFVNRIPVLSIVLLAFAGAPTSAQTWSTFPIASEIAPRNYTAVYDSSRDRLIAFGGEAGDYEGIDVLEMSIPAWSVLRIPRGPTSRTDHASVLDEPNRRLIVVGGGLNADVWELTLENPVGWHLLSPGGATPGGWSGHTAILDRPRNRVLVFGGARAPNQPYSNEVWELTLAPALEWHLLATAGGAPPGRRDHAAIYDPVRERMIVCDGTSAIGALQDVWELSLSGTPTWNTIAVPGAAPEARAGHAVAYDPPRDRMLLATGRTNAGVWIEDLWTLDLGASPAWTQIEGPEDSGPTGRFRSVATYDSRRERLVLFGGRDSLRDQHDTWSRSLASPTANWSLLSPDWGERPLDGSTFATDEVGQRLFAFSGGTTNDQWVASLGDPTPAWKRLAPPGGAPSPRAAPVEVFDSRRNRLVLFSGRSSTPTEYHRDVWTLLLEPGASWQPLFVAGTIPPGRWEGSAAYDSLRDRMVVLLGEGGISPTTGNRHDLGDVHALAFQGTTPTWSEIIPGGPPARHNAGITVDRASNRMIVFGGAKHTLRFAPNDALGDTWSFDLAQDTWQLLSPTGTPPSPRWGAARADDPLQDGIGVFGGMAFNNWLQDCRRLALDPPGWSDMPSLPANAVRGVALYDRTGSRVVVAIGSAAWVYEFPPPPPPPSLLVDCPPTQTWDEGSILPLDFPMETDLPGAQFVDYTVTCDRAWPGFPLQGYVTIVGQGSAHVGIPVPDSAAVGVVTLGFRANLRGDPRGWDSCGVRLHDVTTATTVSPVRVDTRFDRVVVTWFTPDHFPPPFLVERRAEDDVSWIPEGPVIVQSQGRLVFEDKSVVAGKRYAYRLDAQVNGPGSGPFFAEVVVDVPPASLALRGALPNPAVRDVVLDLALASDAPATLELFDMQGRMVVSRTVHLGPGDHRVNVTAGASLRAGVYLARLTQEAQRITAKVVFVP